jgi:hypothetical protein
MHSDFITLGVWPEDHYMTLQIFTLGSMPALLRFPHRGPSYIAKVSLQRPLLHHAFYRYSHTLHRITGQDSP